MVKNKRRMVSSKFAVIMLVPIFIILFYIPSIVKKFEIIRSNTEDMSYEEVEEYSKQFIGQKVQWKRFVTKLKYRRK